MNQNKLIQSFLSTWAIMRLANLSTRSILTPVIFLFCIVFFRYSEGLLAKRKEDSATLGLSLRRLNSMTLIGSVLFTAFILAGESATLIDNLDNRLFQGIILAVSAAGLLILLYHILLLVFIYASHYSLPEEENPAKLLPYVGFLFCFLCWLPYFLYEYPGIMTPDSINQFEQVLGMVSYSNHHPWVHTKLIGFFYHLGSIFTSDMNAALAFFTIFQMLFMAATVMWLIATLQELRVKNMISLLIIAFYALVPYHGVFAVTIWKDVLFSGSVLLFTTALLRLLFLYPEYQKGKKILTLTVYTISGLMMCLFRTNGWYAFLLSLPFLIYTFRHKLKLMLPIHIGILAAVLIIKGPVMDSYAVTQPDFVESICIPLQQVARVICEDKTLTEEEWSLVHNVIDTTYIKELYSPGFADNMKELVRAGYPEYLAEHKGEFLKLWLTLGLRYPGTYLSAYIDQTIGYWYPDVTYTVADIDGIISNNTGLFSQPLLGGPLVVKTKEILLKLGDMLPLYGLLFSMGAMFWALICFIIITVIKKHKDKYILFLPGLAIIMTLFIATPVSSEFRYAYSLAYTLPLYMLIPFLKE